MDGDGDGQGRAGPGRAGPTGVFRAVLWNVGVGDEENGISGDVDGDVWRWKWDGMGWDGDLGTIHGGSSFRYVGRYGT